MESGGELCRVIWRERVDNCRVRNLTRDNPELLIMQEAVLRKRRKIPVRCAKAQARAQLQDDRIPARQRRSGAACSESPRAD